MDIADVGHYRGQFFQVLHTTEQTQTAVMTIEPGRDAGPAEVHEGDQIVYVIEGEALVRVGGETHTLGPGAVVTIPARTEHHVKNPGRVPLFCLTIYAPPEY